MEARLQEKWISVKEIDYQKYYKKDLSILMIINLRHLHTIEMGLNYME